MSLIRGSSLSGLTELMTRLGGDIGGLLREVGIQESAVGSHQVFIPLTLAVEAVEAAASITATPDFGRLLADLQGIEILGPVGLAALTSATLGDGMMVLERSLSTYSPGVAVRLCDTSADDAVFFQFMFVDRDICATVQCAELALGVVLRIFRFLLGNGFSPISAHLPHRPLLPPREYRDDYGCAVFFGSGATGFTMRREDLQLPLRHDGRAHRAALRQLADASHPHDIDVRSVEALVVQLLATGTVTLELIAARLDIHPKALQRRLSGEGSTFENIVDGVRRGRAEHLLRHSDMPLQQLAHDLGYAEHSVLTRSCRRWFGCTPSAYRAVRG